MIAFVNQSFVLHPLLEYFGRQLLFVVLVVLSETRHHTIDIPYCVQYTAIYVTVTVARAVRDSLDERLLHGTDLRFGVDGGPLDDLLGVCEALFDLRLVKNLTYGTSSLFLHDAPHASHLPAAQLSHVLSESVVVGFGFLHTLLCFACSIPEALVLQLDIAKTLLEFLFDNLAADSI